MTFRGFRDWGVGIWWRGSLLYLPYPLHKLGDAGFHAIGPFSEAVSLALSQYYRQQKSGSVASDNIVLGQESRS